MVRTRLTGILVLGTLLLAALGSTAFAPAVDDRGAADDYTDAEYRDHDLDNYTRARARMYQEALDPSYGASFASACADSQGRAALKQGNELRNGRVYGGVGQATCWWSVGHAPDYHDVTPHRVHFFARTGAKLQGHVWGLENAGRRPGVVITTGSIQASDQMYWWAARALAAAGYVVLTYDVQGQGQSETFSHEPGSPVPGTQNVPSQQDANFYDGTVDALRFFLSTPEEPYVPVGWTDEDVAAARASSDEPSDWVNPGAAVLDRDNLGIVGHSLGARAVSNVQQCSDEADLWKDLELCAGRPYPIRAVIGWDALSGDVTPVVPGMSQESDGYFLFPTLSPQKDWQATDSLGSYATWTEESELDTFTYVVRAGTHIEWSQVPYTPATTYGVHMNTYYTVAWLDRYVWPDHGVNRRGHERLAAGPTLDPEHPSRAAANYMSVRRLSAFRLTEPVGVGDGTGRVLQVGDVRDHAGLSPVGDWAGANQDAAGQFDPAS